MGECIIAKNKETGGIILGNYSLDNHNAIVSSVTGPPIDSKQTSNTFEIGIIGLNEIIDDNWNQGHYYIGDWHFHQNASPLPSMKYDIQMKRNIIDNLLKCSIPILLIIGG